MGDVITDDDVFADQLPAPGRPKKTSQIAMQKHVETVNAKEWASKIAAEGNLQIKVSRTSPTHWPIGSQNRIVGYCTTYHEEVTEDRLQAEWGGGTYMLQALGSDGKQLIAPHYVSITGDPLLSPSQLRKEDDGTQKHVLSTVEKMANQRIEDIRATTAATTAVVESTARTLEKQLDKADQEKQRLEARLAAMQVQLQDAMQPRANPQQDKLVEMIAQNTMNQANMSTQRYESELRQTKELAADNERRLQAAFERDKASIVEAAQRELQLVRSTLEQANHFMKASFEREIDNLKSSFEHRSLAEKTTLNTELILIKSKLEDTQAQLVVKEAELVALRAKKDQTLQEKVQEVETFREFFSAKGEEAEPAAGVTGMIGKLMESPMMKNIASKVIAGAMEPPAAAPAAAPAPAQQALPARLPPPQLRRAPAPKAPAKAAAPLAPMVAPQPETMPAPPPPPPVTSGEVEAAVTYCRAAFDNGQDPAEFAASVKDLIPANVLHEIRNKGADEFLRAHGKSEAFSTQPAKNWIRKVTQTLNR